MRKAQSVLPNRTMTAHKTTTNRLASIVEMFVDETVDESYSRGRLTTRRLGNGNVGLIGYGWAILAEYNAERNLVFIHQGFDGHSTTFTRWIGGEDGGIVGRIAGERRNVLYTESSPIVAAPNGGVRFVGAYIGSVTKMSAVDKAAKAEVEESIAQRLA